MRRPRAPRSALSTARARRKRGRHTRHGPHGAAAGFSLVEVLIAAVILLLISIGILPLFTRAILNNTAGNSALLSISYSQIEVESETALPFLGEALVIPPGLTTVSTDETWTQGLSDHIGDTNEGWHPGTPDTLGDPALGTVLWTRQTNLRQYNLDDIQSDDLRRFDNPLDGATLPKFVHLKEVEVIIDSPGEGPLSQGRQMTLRTLKAF